MDTVPLTVEQVKAFLDSDPEGQKLTQSMTDAKVTKGIETWRQNNLDKLLTERVEQEITKRYPAETEEQKRLRVLEDKLAASEQARNREALRVVAREQATAKGIPPSLVDHFLGQDENQTAENLAKLESELAAYKQRTVEELYRSLGRQPITTTAADQQTTFTTEQITRMSPQERDAQWGAISKAMAEGRVK